MPTEAADRLASLAAQTPVRELDAALDAAVEDAVKQTVDRVRAAQAERVELAWQAAAAEFRARAQHRIDALQAVAADVFDVELPPFEAVALAAQRARFFYLFLRLETPEQAVARWLRPLAPHGYVRRRLLGVAQRRLASEIDKHAGRARWDISQRLDAARNEYERTMRTQLDQLIDGIDSLARFYRRADHRREEAEGALRTFEHRATVLRAATADVRSLVV